MSDPLKPSLSLLSKIGSIVVHTDELQSTGGQPHDAAAIRSLLMDPEVTEWREQMTALALLPVKR